MDSVRSMRVVILAVGVMVATPAAAFYANPSVPAGTGGGPGGWTYTPSTPTPTGGGRISGGTASITVGGQTIGRGVSWGLGAGAGRAVAGAIVRGGLIGAGWGLAGWAAEQCVHVRGGGLYLKCGGGDDDPGTRPYMPAKREFTRDSNPWGRGQGGFSSASQACNSIGSWPKTTITAEAIGVTSDGLRRYRCVVEHTEAGKQGEFGVSESFSCPPGSTMFAPGKCSLSTDNEDGKPLTPEEATDLLAGRLPPNIPPGITVPVENPIWNPTPGTNPRPKPVVTPIGDPVPQVQTAPLPSPVTPAPGSDPQTQTQRITWVQPAVEIVHSPTVDQPLRLEVTPIDVPVAGPAAGLNPNQDQRPGTGTGSGTGAPTGTDTSTVPEASGGPGLCAEYPDILACQTLDDVDGDEVRREEMAVAWQIAPGFARPGRCPADKKLSVMGKPVTITWGPICQLAEGVRPIVLAFAALTAVAIIVGVGRRQA